MARVTFAQITYSEAIKKANSAVNYLLAELEHEAHSYAPTADPTPTPEEVEAALEARRMDREVFARLRTAFLETHSKEYVILPDNPGADITSEQNH